MVSWRLALASWWRIVTGYQADLNDGWLQVSVAIRPLTLRRCDMETFWTERMIASQVVRKLMFKNGKLRSVKEVEEALVVRYGPQSDPTSIKVYVEEEYNGLINHFQMMEGYSRDPNWSRRLGFKFGRKEFKQLCPDYDGVARLIDDWYTNIS